MHPFDPLGRKVGGLETYIRDFIRLCPPDFSILMVGADGAGQRELGRTIEVALEGRPFTFLPILHYPEDEMHEAATRLTKSITLNFFIQLARYLPTTSKLTRDGTWSAELRRMEFALIPTLMRLPFVQMLHGEGAPHQQMDSLLRRYWFLQNINERFSLSRCEKFLCVNPFITQRVRRQYPSHANKVETLTTWANPQIYKPTQFRQRDGMYRIAFAGRLDNFKRPSVMFDAIAKISNEFPGEVAFHYIGASDPFRFPEFSPIRPITVLHGQKNAEEIAELMSTMDAGILTSEFEGMPRFVLEMLRSGRPIVALHLPQLEPVIEDGVSGFLVHAPNNAAEQADAVAEKLAALRKSICANKLDPFAISKKVEPYSPETLLGRVYQIHREIQNGQRSKCSQFAAGQSDA